MIREFVCANEGETERLGAAIAKALGCVCGALVALYGDLGAGKTVFVRGMARELGINDTSSPTFTIVHEHERLLHFDAYRLSSAEELYDIGFDDYLDRGVLIAMEWADNVAKLLPKDRLDVLIIGSGDLKRSITVTAWGAPYERALSEVIL